MRDEPARDDRTDWMNVVLERRRNPEVAAAAANCPEQIRVLVGARVCDAGVRHHDLGRPEVIERQTVLRHQPTQTATERQPGDARAPDDTAGRRQTVDLRFAIELGPEDTTLCARHAGARVDVDSLHRRQVDHQPAVDGGMTCDVVPAATDRDLEIERSGQLDGIAYVGNTTAACNQRGTLVDESIVNAPRVLVIRVGQAGAVAR